MYSTFLNVPHCMCIVVLSAAKSLISSLTSSVYFCYSHHCELLFINSFVSSESGLQQRSFGSDFVLMDPMAAHKRSNESSNHSKSRWYEAGIQDKLNAVLKTLTKSEDNIGSELRKIK